MCVCVEMCVCDCMCVCVCVCVRARGASPPKLNKRPTLDAGTALSRALELNYMYM